MLTLESDDPMSESDPMQSNSAANSVNPPIIFHNTPSFNSQGVSGVVGDWRAPLERERVVNKMYELLFFFYEKIQYYDTILIVGGGPTVVELVDIMIQY
ncbi:hypothetical protein HanLR1_Chr05g0179931 [Helianthus annuus]|nr:hypothetical protein HanHA89_Chr05g0190521 [Helianthus annuus]KAJ0750272.1 hypothetical protein HanLR1_Chr05g0179931 [Helianthus annuus]